MATSGRTRGDGMEYVEPPKSDIQRKLSNEKNLFSNRKPIPGATSIYRQNDKTDEPVKLPATIPQGKQFYLVPHLVNTKKSFSLKNKEPRFVPFEPYKAAVSVIHFRRKC